MSLTPEQLTAFEAFAEEAVIYQHSDLRGLGKTILELVAEVRELASELDFIKAGYQAWREECAAKVEALRAQLAQRDENAKWLLVKEQGQGMTNAELRAELVRALDERDALRRVAAPLQWSREVPKEPGWYWLATQASDGTWLYDVRELEMTMAGPRLAYDGGNEPPDDWTCFLSIPLPPAPLPEEPR